MGMTREEAKAFLTDISHDLGTVGIEYLSVKDGEKMRDAIETLEQEPRWIPMVRREPTDEEKAEYLAQNGEELCYMLENKMPLDGQEVLVSVGKFVSEDVFDEDFYNFENSDIENVDAWMPKPKPYSEVEA